MTIWNAFLRHKFDALMVGSMCLCVANNNDGKAKNPMPLSMEEKRVSANMMEVVFYRRLPFEVFTLRFCQLKIYEHKVCFKSMWTLLSYLVRTRQEQSFPIKSGFFKSTKNCPHTFETEFRSQRFSLWHSWQTYNLAAVKILSICSKGHW